MTRPSCRRLEYYRLQCVQIGAPDEKQIAAVDELIRRTKCRQDELQAEGKMKVPDAELEDTISWVVK